MISDIQINNSNFGSSNDAANCLIIEISRSQIHFCELNTDQNTILFSANYNLSDATQNIGTEFINAVKYFQLTKKNYNAVYVNYFTHLFTLCPVNFYAKENLRTLLEFNVGTTGEQFIETDDISSDIKLIYAIDVQLKSNLNTVFPNHHIHHTISVLSKLMLNTEELNKENILISVHDTHIELVVKENHKLILANQYSIKTQEDVLYYILFILEQYQFNPLFVNVSVCGNIESSASLILSLKKYIKNIRLVKGHKNINWQAVNGMPQHFNYTLTNRIFCE